jgi:hypothetical protein
VKQVSDKSYDISPRDMLHINKSLVNRSKVESKAFSDSLSKNLKSESEEYKENERRL